jgi:ABC-type phosphate transport system substrate-binding protein
MRALVVIVALVSTLTLPGAHAPLAQPPPPIYRIVIHPDNPVSALERRFLEDAFLKRVRSWPSGEIIRPVDLEPRSEVRRHFTEGVLRRPVSAVRAYWQQRIFSGRDIPPPELPSDEAVTAYVKRYPGAIGYLSGAAATKGLKVLTIR